MANELLDFVMSLVRDPEVAARYAADPAGAIAEANLANVTRADVDNLIPVVSDSLSMATPSFGTAVPVDDNVWTSGAAAQAFDAFDAFAPAVPETGLSGLDDVPATVIDTDLAAAAGARDLDPQLPVVEQVAGFDVFDEPEVHEPAGWDQGVLDSPVAGDDGPADEAPGFDLF